jgi:ABC-type multidrug transport system, ATPase and permease components
VLVSILNNDVNELDNFLTDYVSNLIHIITGLVGAAVVLISLNWQLALVTLFPIPFMALFSAVYAGKIREKYGSIRRAVGGLHSRVKSSVRGILTVKAFVAEEYEYGRVRDSSDDYFSARWEMQKVRTLFFPSLNLANYVGFAITLLVGSYWIVVGPPGFFAGELTTGTLVAFLTYNRQFNTPLIKLGTVLDQYEKARSSLVRVFALADCPV